MYVSRTTYILRKVKKQIVHFILVFMTIGNKDNKIAYSTCELIKNNPISLNRLELDIFKVVIWLSIVTSIPITIDIGNPNIIYNNINATDFFLLEVEYIYQT